MLSGGLLSVSIFLTSTAPTGVQALMRSALDNSPMKAAIVEPANSNWVAVVAFALLGVFFLQKAIRRHAKRRWTWGHGGPVPVSRPGYAAWGLIFIVIGAAIAHGPKPAIAYVVLFVVCFISILCVGLIDTYRYNKVQRRNSRGPDRSSTQ